MSVAATSMAAASAGMSATKSKFVGQSAQPGRVSRNIAPAGARITVAT